MRHSEIRFLLLLVVMMGVASFATAVSAADPSPVCTVCFTGTEERKTFEAYVEERKFTTLASLEEYLATFPAGKQMKFVFDDGAIFAEAATSPQMKQYRDTLKEFCAAHQFKFRWAVNFH